MQTKAPATIESFFDGFELTEKPSDAVEMTTITIWVPRTYKDKYSELQAASGRKFGKCLKNVVMTSIDRFRGTDRAS